MSARNEIHSHQLLKSSGATYRILAKAGHGLSSEVYRAVREDSRGYSKHTVALKVLKSKTAIPWLRREFETLARVRSPHCVQVLAWENYGDQCALVLEWIEGVSLTELARVERLSQTAIEEVVNQVQEGLRALAEVGLHHGDLSPSNILLDRSGSIRLIDFGTPPSEQNKAHGTPGYLAPEIWLGHPTSIRSDLFALGMIELDLKQSVLPTDLSLADAKARVTARSTTEVGWLNEDPSMRDFRASSSSAFAKAELRECVERMLMRRSARIETVPIAAEPSVGSKQRIVVTSLSTLLLVLGVTLPGLADAPSSVELQEKRSTIEIRSHHWMKVQINGVDVGYAPVSINHLRPGTHRISWRTYNRKGDTTVYAAPGGLLRLNEGHLAQRSTRIKD